MVQVFVECYFHPLRLKYNVIHGYINFDISYYPTILQLQQNEKICF